MNKNLIIVVVLVVLVVISVVQAFQLSTVKSKIEGGAVVSSSSGSESSSGSSLPSSLENLPTMVGGC